MFSTQKSSKKNLYEGIELGRTTWDMLHELHKIKMLNHAQVPHDIKSIESETRKRKNGIEKLHNYLDKYIEKNSNKAPTDYKALNLLLYYVPIYKTNQPFAAKAFKITQAAIIKYDQASEITKEAIIGAAIKDIKVIYDELEKAGITDKSETKTAIKNFLMDYYIPTSSEEYHKFMRCTPL